MSSVYNSTENVPFTPGVTGKFFLYMAGVKPDLVKNIPDEARAHRLIGKGMFLLLLMMLAGQLYLFFKLDITFPGFLLGIALTCLFFVMVIFFLRYVNSGAYAVWLAGILMIVFVIISWALLVPASLSYQKNEIKRGIEEYRLFQKTGIQDTYMRDSASAYKNDDSSAVRDEQRQLLQSKIGLAEAYLATKNDSISLLNKMSDSLQKKYSTNEKITRLLGDSIKRVQKSIAILESQRTAKWNQLNTIQDSVKYIQRVYSKNNYDKTFVGLQALLQRREKEVQLEIYNLRNRSNNTKALLKKVSADLEQYLLPGKNYTQLTNILTDLTQAQADAEAELKILKDSLYLVNTSGSLAPQLALLKSERDSLFAVADSRPVNWLTVGRATGLLNNTDPDFKTKFVLVSLLWALPVLLLFSFAVFRNNYYRSVYEDYTHLQQERTQTTARSFIELEKLKNSNMYLDEQIKGLGGENNILTESEMAAVSSRPEDYYYAAALKQEEIVKKTKNTPYYDPGVAEEGISNINKAISLAAGRSEFWELKSKLLFLNDMVSESQKAAEKFRELRAVELFKDNVDKKIWLDEIAVEGLPFFGSFSWRLNPGVNILLGRNGYGKSHFLSILCAMLKNDYHQSEKLSRINDSKTTERYIKLYLAGDFKQDSELVRLRKEEIKELQAQVKTLSAAADGKNNSRQMAAYKESIRKKKQEIEVEEGMILLTPSDLVSGKGQIPVMAIPDMRFVNKAKEFTDSNVSDLLKGDEYLKNTSYHFINQEPFEAVLQNLLNILGVSYFENGRSFDAYIFRIVSDVFLQLTGNRFKWQNCEADTNGSYKITVLTEGSKTPLAIQKISQGTFSVLSMVGLIYLFLKKKYPGLQDQELVKQQAIIVIDEIDAHLHPLWQQKIAGIIRGIFYNCQFIITAHSPMIVAGCKEDEVSVMRDERDESNNISSFMVYQFKEDFIGTSIETLYNRIFEVENKDQQYVRYTAMQPFLVEMTEEKKTLENKQETALLTDAETLRLKQLSDDLYYAGKVKEKQKNEYQSSVLESENTALKITVESLNQRIKEITNSTEK